VGQNAVIDLGVEAGSRKRRILCIDIGVQAKPKIEDHFLDPTEVSFHAVSIYHPPGSCRIRIFTHSQYRPF